MTEAMKKEVMNIRLESLGRAFLKAIEKWEAEKNEGSKEQGNGGCGNSVVPCAGKN